MEYWFPTLTESVHQLKTSPKLNICTLHEDLLGKTVDECIEDFGPATIESNTWSDRHSSSQTPARKVVATSIGVRGDVQVSTNLYLMQSKGTQRERLTSSENEYRRIMAESQIERAVRRRTISDKGLVSGSNFAIDNRGLLPPFSPVQRCQDSVFTALLHTCFDAYVGFLPWMVSHRRPVRRVPSTETTLRRTHLLSGDLIWLMTYHLATELTAKKAVERLVQLGKMFVEYSSAPPPKFHEMLRGLAVKSNSFHLASINRLLQVHEEKPDFWASDLKRYRSWIRNTIPDPELDVTDDLLEAGNTTEVRALFQNTVFRFGQLLLIWPDLYRAAHELHAQGLRVGTKL